VSSPKESPSEEQKNIPQTPIENIIMERSQNVMPRSIETEDPQPIGVNDVPRNIANVFYDYESHERNSSSHPSDTQSLQYERTYNYQYDRQYSQDDLDMIDYKKSGTSDKGS
jgi:hypothetical protein